MQSAMNSQMMELLQHLKTFDYGKFKLSTQFPAFWNS